MAKGIFHLPIVSANGTGGGNLTPEPYVRPSDWLAIDHLVNIGDQKFVALVAIFEEGNFISVECLGNYTVNWGDGTSTNHTQSTVAYHQYDYNYSGFTGTECSRGYKQAILTIIPQAGQNLTYVRFNTNHNQAGLATTVNNGLLDVKASGSNFIQITFANSKNRLLEQFDFVGTNSINTCANMFSGCQSLKQVKNLYTNNSASFTSMFLNCYELEHIPHFNTSNGVNFSSMFQNCYKLKSVPLFDLSVGQTFTSMFNTCVSIVEFPNFNCNSGTTFTSMFELCRSMIKNPAIITNASLTKVFASMFNGCTSLREFVPFNTMQASTYASMFLSCSALEILPATIDTSGTVTNVQFNSMFQNCHSMEKAPMMDLSKGTNCSNLFGSCWSVTEFPSYDFSSATSLTSAFGTCLSLRELPVMTIGTGITSFNTTFTTCHNLVKAPNWNLQNATDVTNMFNGCTSLVEAPNYNLSAVTNTSPFMFGGCSNLIKGVTTGMRYSITYNNCKLSRQAIVDIFNGLGTAVGTQTIRIDGNYGASSLTSGERAIATGKGWTIVG